jgi:DNA-binding CsgD family transcriptional regulator/tetratricopeptide (TPR) repeat protein
MPDYTGVKVSDQMRHLPGQLRLTPSFPFAGRTRELAALRALLPSGDGDGLGLALVGGEAGSGKSRLVREFAREAAGDSLLLYGACDSVVRRPYGPFVEALEQLVRRSDDETLRDAVGTGTVGGELSRLLPDLAQRVAGLSPPVAADPDTERHRLHSAVADLLVAAGHRVPLVIVIEDVHWADTPTLLLLRHLAHAGVDASALIVTTFRDTEAEIPEALSAALVELRRADGVTRLRLGGLSTEEVAEFVRSAGGDQLGADTREVGRVLHQLTGGNAFLLTELWRTVHDTDVAQDTADGRQLAETLSQLGSPDGVREVVAQRLGDLQPATSGLLEIAAVVGYEFDLAAVAPSGLADAALQAALGEAIAHGMIEEVPSRGLSFRFTHELVRRALYDRLGALRRAELHLQVGATLERAAETGAGGHVAELAYHFAAAAPIDGPERAIAYSIQAGRAALRSLDFEGAEMRFTAALGLGIADPPCRAEVQMELGTARFRAGRSDEAIAAFRAAAEIAREIDDAELLAAAAVGFEEACWRPGITDEGAVELLEEASEALDDDDSELRVKLLAGRSRALAFIGHYEESAVAERAAIAMARRLDDRLGLATVLMRSYWSRAQRSLDRTLAMLTEARELAEELGDTDIQAEAMEWRVAGLIALGDLRTAERELAEVHALAAGVRQPFPLHVAEHYASTLALCAGQLDEAEAAARRSHEWSRLLTGRPASGVYGIQMFGIRREQGRLAELAGVMRTLAGGDRSPSVWRPGFAALLAELGMEDEARHQLEQVRRDGFDPLRSSLWVASLTYLAEACSVVGDSALAALVYPELAPLSGGNVVVGHGVACYGAADRFLGLLAATLADLDRAVAHFERAMTINRRMGAHTWLAHTMFAYGRTLLIRRGSGDARHASELLSGAATLAEQIGMPGLLRRAGALGAGQASATSLPDELTGREVEVLRLVAAGLSNRGIGEELSISGHTVANHIRSILRKTGAANRTEATGYAYRHSLMNTPSAV